MLHNPFSGSLTPPPSHKANHVGTYTIVMVIGRLVSCGITSTLMHTWCLTMLVFSKGTNDDI